MLPSTETQKEISYKMKPNFLYSFLVISDQHTLLTRDLEGLPQEDWLPLTHYMSQSWWVATPGTPLLWPVNPVNEKPKRKLKLLQK